MSIHTDILPGSEVEPLVWTEIDAETFEAPLYGPISVRVEGIRGRYLVLQVVAGTKRFFVEGGFTSPEAAKDAAFDRHAEIARKLLVSA